MKKSYLLLVIGFVILLQGCGVSIEDEVNDHYTKVKATKRLHEMCSREELFICGDNVEDVMIKNNSVLMDMDDMVAYTYEHFSKDINYKYKIDREQFGLDDYYEYMRPKSDGLMYGDCEDFTITLFENGVRDGYIKRGEANWVIGSYNGDIHAWLTIKKDEITYIYDNINPHGVNIIDMYGDKYKRFRTIVSY